MGFRRPLVKPSQTGAHSRMMAPTLAPPRPVDHLKGGLGWGSADLEVVQDRPIFALSWARADELAGAYWISPSALLLRYSPGHGFSHQLRTRRSLQFSAAWVS